MSILKKITSSKVCSYWNKVSHEKSNQFQLLLGLVLSDSPIHFAPARMGLMVLVIRKENVDGLEVQGLVAVQMDLVCAALVSKITYYFYYHYKHIFFAFSVQKSCDGTTTSNNTYFTSPSFPSSYAGGSTCSFTIKKLSNDICQVNIENWDNQNQKINGNLQARIDFIAMTLDQPNADGSCVNDWLTIIGGGSPVPTICGENGGQHIYVNFAEKGSIQMNIFTGVSTNTRRIWNFKISQIAFDCPTRGNYH